MEFKIGDIVQNSTELELNLDIYASSLIRIGLQPSNDGSIIVFPKGTIFKILQVYSDGVYRIVSLQKHKDREIYTTFSNLTPALEVLRILYSKKCNDIR